MKSFSARSLKEDLIPKSKTLSYENVPQHYALALQGSPVHNSSLVFCAHFIVLALHDMGSIDPDLLVDKSGSCAQVPAVLGQSVLQGHEKVLFVISDSTVMIIPLILCDHLGVGLKI